MQNFSLSEERRVALCRCDSYDPSLLKELLSAQWRQIGLTEDFFRDKKVVLKPNLVRKMDASLAGTTHPAVAVAVAELCREWGAADVLMVESPGGPYTEGALRAAYRICGMEAASEGGAFRLNYDTAWQSVDYPDGVASKSFHILTPILEADVVVNLCKLKSHGLTMMTGAVKNYFGTIPGTEKFEMHARFPDIRDFSEQLVDLCAYHAKARPMLNVMDAVVGMEGNGPTNGKARKIGALLSSQNPFALDDVASRLIGLERKVIHLEQGRERGYIGTPTVIGEAPESLRVEDFLPPDSAKKNTITWLSEFWGGRLMRFFEPRPAINKKKCVGCGECVRSCPAHTITMNEKKRRPVIEPSACIKCFCCQELCPKDAVKIKQNFLIKLVK
ncbi:MAG: DUF362 domain-containing protein [Clostridia bacterium]|nr:DUF362 domain-containing protein [Clostridia bacterium]